MPTPAEAAAAYAAADRLERNGATADPVELAGAEARERRSGPRWWAWLLALLLVLLLAGGGVAAYLLTRPTRVLVPRIVGENQAVAQATVQSHGFTPNVIQQSSTQAAGTVIDQSPLGGYRADQGSTVTLTVSQGPGDVNVPPISQLAEKVARRAIARVGLIVGRIVPESSQTVASGFATRTDPGAGIALPAGSSVTLFVSSGLPPVQVPDVTGEPVAQARADLTNKGFTVTTTDQPSDSAQPQTVTSQTPNGGTSAKPGTAVTIVVAVPVPMVAVPTVVGQKAGAAARALTQAGFTVQQQTTTVTVKADNGRVVSQNPSGGTAKQGSAVTITVGKYKKPTGTGTTGPSTTPTGTTTTPTGTTTTPTTTGALGTLPGG